MAEVAIVAGYLVRCPLGGYAWQALHYLEGLRRLGFDPYFYEDTAWYPLCFDPRSGQMGDAPEAGIELAAAFFAAHGYADRWSFWDAGRDRYAGCGAEQTRAALADAKLLIGLSAVNRLPRQVGRRRAFVDLDPGVTQIQAERDQRLRALLAEYDVHFSIGENIGQPGCAVPTAGFTWHATRQPIALPEWSPLPPRPRAPLTTIGRWDDGQHEQELAGVRYSWSKREQWLRFLDLPRRSGTTFELATDVDKTPGDDRLLAAHGWSVVDPLVVSADADRYRDYIRNSLAEFSVAKDLNVRLATGWFSDRSACYLAAGRPVILQDTGFQTHLPTGAGLMRFTTLDEAVDAVHSVVRDWPLHSAAARRIAEQHFAASWVLADLLDRAGV